MAITESSTLDNADLVLSLDITLEVLRDLQIAKKLITYGFKLITCEAE